MPAKKPSPAPAAKGGPELDLIRSLAAILNDTGLSEIELDRKGTRVRVSRTMTAVAAVAAAPVHAPAPVHHAAAAKAADADHPGTVKSPMVGTVYRAPAPEAAPFVEVGDVLRKDTVVCIIEAMKVMNEIKADVEGEVLAVLAQNGEAVEFGEALVVIE